MEEIFVGVVIFLFGITLAIMFLIHAYRATKSEVEAEKKAAVEAEKLKADAKERDLQERWEKVKHLEEFYIEIHQSQWSYLLDEWHDKPLSTKVMLLEHLGESSRELVQDRKRRQEELDLRLIQQRHIRNPYYHGPRKAFKEGE